MVQQQVALDVYARVSRLGDNRQRSTEGQVDDCANRVTERGARVAEVHVDSGRSAWNPRVHRPGWDRLMARLESGATGGVVVFDLARFSRRPIEGERLISAAERGLLVLDSEDEYDLCSANGKKAFRDQLAGAAYESDRLSTRVRRGKRLKALRGEHNGSSRPFGFEPDGVSIRESEADELRTLVDRLLRGDSQDDMVIDLNTRGVLTSYGRKWSPTALRQVLTRPRNAGLVEYKGAIVGRVDGPTIITEDDHNRVLALFASRRRGRPSTPTYLCSGIAVCGLCGHTLSGHPRPNMRPYSDGAIRRRYWCAPRAAAADGGCGRVSVDQRGLDEHVRALVVAILSDPRHAAAVESAARTTADEIARLDHEIAEADQLAVALADRMGRGELSLARYDAAVGPLDRRLAELGTRRDALDAAADLPVPADVAAASRADWLRRWDAATVPERRTLIRRALRGRRLAVTPADPHDRTNIGKRVSVKE